MPWQLPANRNGSRRERFSGPLAVLALFCAFVLVLAFLYPEQGLLGVLGEGDDAATIRYREAMLRIAPENNKLRLKVAGSLLRTGSSRRALALLDYPQANFTAEQQRTAIELRYSALQDLFRHAAQGGTHWQQLRPRVLAAAREMSGANPPAWRLEQLAADARAAGDISSYNDYRTRYDAMTAQAKAAAAPADPVSLALARRDYRSAAAACFSNMGHAATITERRKLFMQGVRILQSGNLPLEALDAGERHIDGLASDRPTLIFLTRVGLAANQPGRAQVFIKKALGMKTEGGKAGSS